MAFLSFVRTRGYRNFMAKLYGIGAAVVIMGALFKINHYPGANGMLIMGLCTESIIFFFSAFEPPHVEPDWSLVYPELAGMYTSEESVGPKLKDKDLTKELDKMLAEAKIGPELIDSLGKGLQSLSNTTSQLSSVANATVATEEYVKNLEKGSKGLGALNAVYEIQLQAAQKQNDASSALEEKLGVFIKNINESIDKTAQYKQGVDSLAQHLAALNKVYGNMLAAMNINVNTK
jgi:hypothetical protein